MSDISVSKKDEKEVKSSELAASLGIAESTVRKYSQTLEEAGYKFKKDVTGARIFSVKEFKLFSDMLKYKEKAGFGIKQAAIASVTQSATQNEVAIQPTQDVHSLGKLVSGRVEGLEKAIQEMQNTMLQMEKKRIENTRTETITAQLTIRRVENNLRQEAAELWQQEPEEKRLISVGFLFKKKVENKDAKEEFIRNYINENLENRI